MKNRDINKIRLFGTDGIRGTPGKYPLTDSMLCKLGKSAAYAVYRQNKHKRSLKVVIGRDTRITGSSIEGVLSDALTRCGINVYLAGIITTPGLSFLVKTLKADMGIMISASHNKASENGIKIFNFRGYKLSPREELLIEEGIFNNGFTAGVKLPHKTGRVYSLKTAQQKYVKFLISTVKGLSLNGIHIALDCAWGAASPFAAKLFKKLGAKVTAIHDSAHGHNINLGGSTKPEFIRELVSRAAADIGIALDGDGDRIVVSDENGNVADGDIIMGIIAKHRLEQNTLPLNGIVTTVMSNFGLRSTIESCGGRIAVTDVGDKHVLDALIKNNFVIGGEQSGHIIFLEHLPAPDGLLVALQVLKLMDETRLPLSLLIKCIPKFPQVLVNVKVKEKRPFKEMPAVWEKLTISNMKLKNDGRVLLRYSGTEPLARIMVEGRDKKIIEGIAVDLAEQIRREIGVLSEKKC